MLIHVSCVMKSTKTDKTNRFQSKLKSKRNKHTPKQCHPDPVHPPLLIPRQLYVLNLPLVTVLIFRDASNSLISPPLVPDSDLAFIPALTSPLPEILSCHPLPPFSGFQSHLHANKCCKIEWGDRDHGTCMAVPSDGLTPFRAVKSES